MLRIYLAAPIGANDDGWAGRIAAAARACEELFRAGFAVYLPHGYEAAGIDLLALFGYKAACRLSGAFVAVCDALLRLPGESPGADEEVALAESLGIPVFYSLAALVEWGENVAACDAADEMKQEHLRQRRGRLRMMAADLRVEYRALPEETPEEARDAARWAIQKAEHEERLLARQERGEPVRRA